MRKERVMGSETIRAGGDMAIFIGAACGSNKVDVEEDVGASMLLLVDGVR